MTFGEGERDTRMQAAVLQAIFCMIGPLDDTAETLQQLGIAKPSDGQSDHPRFSQHPPYLTATTKCPEGKVLVLL
jgi:hypothetical protein